jgi:hypothetical protein
MILIAVVAIVLVIAIVLLFRAKAPGGWDPQTRELRERVFTMTPSDAGIETAPNQAWVVVMDMNIGGGTASLVALKDGSTSLYTSSGGGIIGGGEHESVALATRRFVQSATDHLSKLERADSHEPPPAGTMRFYVRTGDGLYVASAPEGSLGEEHELNAMWMLGQDVLRHLRETTEAR